MPYAPGTEYRGDQYIFQGGRQTAETLAGWLQNFLQQEKQVTNAGKSADYFVKSNANADGTNPVLKEMGIHEDEWANLGARDKASAVSGLLQSRNSRDQAVETQSRIDLRNAEAAKARTEDDATTGMPDFARYLNEELSQPAPSPTWPPPGQADWQGFLQGKGPVQTPGTATGTNGAAQPLSMTQHVLRALQRVQAMNPQVAKAIASRVLPQLIANNGTDDTPPIATTLDTPNGPLAIISKRGSKEFMIDPRAAVDARTQGQKDILDAKGSRKDISPETQLKALSTQIAAIRRVPATMRTQEDADDLAQLMSAQQSLLSGRSATPPPPASGGPAAPPKVTTQAQFNALDSGTLYLGKDGKQYRKP